MVADGGIAVLVLIAAVLAPIGVLAAWVAGHPETVRAWARAVARRRWLLRLAGRYRRQLDFLVGRLRPEGAYGLTLTVGLAVLGLAVYLFGGLLDSVLAGEEVALLDGPVSRVVAAHRLGWLTSVMRGVTWLGSGWVGAGVVLGAGLAFWWRTRRWQPLLLLAVTASGAGVLDTVVKLVTARPRPPASLMVATGGGWAFPSGHTTQTAVYGALAFLLARVLRGWRARVAVWAGAVALAVLVGLSRLYLGVHWLTDVLGGWLLAVAWVTVVLTVTTTIGRRSRATSPPGTAQPPSETTQPPTPAGEPGAARPAVEVAAERGLDADEVARRVAAGRVNTVRQASSRGLGQIVAANAFTRFNALLGSLAVLTLWLGPPQDAVFGVIIAANTTIGTVQELRAKRVLDRLVLVAAPRARVVRAGEVVEVPADRLVLDDIVELAAGDQVPVDGLVRTADGLEVDESLLTGEADPVSRHPGEYVLAGSVVVAGLGRVRAVRVGPDTYARRLAAEARRYRPTVSELRAGTDRILRYVTWVLVPAAALLTVSQLTRPGIGVADAVRGAVAGVVGLVPEGLVLLTSLAMAAAIVRLGRSRVLVQELAAVEALARVDVLCLDKTGTLTEGRLTLDRLLPAGPSVPLDPATVLAALAAADPHPTASLRAAAAAAADPGWPRQRSVPFSSARKWSAASFADHGTVVLGAPEVVLDGGDGAPLRAEAARQAATGRRVLALAHSGGPLDPDRPALPPDRRPLALVLLCEEIRPDAARTLRYFAEQGVTVKVISGDNRETVAAVARAVGVPDADRAVDAADLPEEPGPLAEAMDRYGVFARTGPQQKRAMVRALHARGHSVAMTGDGVNDVLALKDADLGIGLGTGTPAARAVAALVLLDGRFAALPGVVAEGRRVIGNIDRTARLFVTKTVYVLLLALAVGVAGVPFPFLPRHLTLIATLTIGVPGFFLALAPNARRANPGFVRRVAAFAVPCGTVAAAATLGAYGLARALAPAGQARTAAVLTLAVAGLSVLWLLTVRSAGWQRLLPLVMLAGLGLTVAVPQPRRFFALDLPDARVWAVIAGMAVAGHAFFRLTAGVAGDAGGRG